MGFWLDNKIVFGKLEIDELYSYTHILSQLQPHLPTSCSIDSLLYMESMKVTLVSSSLYLFSTIYVLNSLPGGMRKLLPLIFQITAQISSQKHSFPLKYTSSYFN